MKRIVALLMLFGMLWTGDHATAETATSSQDQAILELLNVLGVEKLMQQATVTMAHALVQADPSMAPYEDIVIKWINKYGGYTALAPEWVKLYKEEFTEEEIRAITAFLRSPAGQKYISKVPELMRKGSRIAITAVQPHADELREMVLQRRKELQGGAGSPQ